MRAVETTSTPNLSGEECKKECCSDNAHSRVPTYPLCEREGSSDRRMCTIGKISTFAPKGEK